MELLLIILGILQIMLFFKVWGMCNDVAEIANKICSQEVTETEQTKQTEETEQQQIEKNQNKYPTTI